MPAEELLHWDSSVVPDDLILLDINFYDSRSCRTIVKNLYEIFTHPGWIVLTMGLGEFPAYLLGFGIDDGYSVAVSC